MPPLTLYRVHIAARYGQPIEVYAYTEAEARAMVGTDHCGIVRVDRVVRPPCFAWEQHANASPVRGEVSNG